MTVLKNTYSLGVFLLFFMFCAQAWASPAAQDLLTGHFLGYVSVALFLIAYAFVIAEEVIELKKSKLAVFVAGIIWLLAAVAARDLDNVDVPGMLRHNLTEYAELFLFLLSAMTYINVLEERNIFNALRNKLMMSGFSLRALYWIMGILAFFISPVADNLTTALVIGAVAMAVGVGYPTFVTVSCISIVVAANAGGAFSPFGDITTLMVWQKGLLGFFDFFSLFIPALVSWLVPAAAMTLAIPKGVRAGVGEDGSAIKPCGLVVLGMFVLTIVMTVLLHSVCHLPPFLGMMTGLGGLMIYGHFINRKERRLSVQRPFDIFISIKRVEWDTLLFFYGIMLCVGGLGAFGYIAYVSEHFYGTLGHSQANILIGAVSAVIDNIPVMFAVLSMNLDMSHGQWLLVTLTAGIGGSLLSIGSAAGVALMGQARGTYTFFSHLKWTWAVALGYAAGIWLHFLLNAEFF